MRIGFHFRGWIAALLLGAALLAGCESLRPPVTAAADAPW